MVGSRPVGSPSHWCSVSALLPFSGAWHPTEMILLAPTTTTSSPRSMRPYRQTSSHLCHTQILTLQPHGACVPLLATTRQRTARMRDNGAQRKRSHLLFEATFPIADRASTPMRTSVPYRATEVRTGDSRNPARPRMISAAKAQSPTASALAMRSRVGNIACVPPQAARPRGAPRARAA